MNARVLARVLFVSIALSLATTSIAFGQTLEIAAPTNGRHILLGHEDGTPVTSADVTFQFTYAGGAQILIYVDEDPLVTLNPAAASTVLTLGVGAHTVAVYLADAAGTPYDVPEAVDTVRFYVSRVCDEDAECLDDDPCTIGSCIGDAALDPDFFGRCRFGPATADSDCCVTSEWCRHAGQAHGFGDYQYRCQDVDMDTVGDCVACVVNADCPLDTCHQSATCQANACVYVPLPGCCEVESQTRDCNDGNSCTVDTCNGETQVCTNAAVANCCIAGSEAEQVGAPDFGCTPAGGGDPCLQYVCIGIATGARCRTGPLFAGCCDADTDCNDPTRLNACTDPDGVGHGSCVAGTGDTGTCSYPKIADNCCVKNYECADQYPENIGTCIVVAGQDWKECSYAVNPEYCVSPIDTIVINEIMVNSGGPEGNKVPDLYGEWIEVYNPTAVDVNINGWTFSDNEPGDGADAFTVDTPGELFMVDAGGFRVLGPSSWTVSNGGVLTGYVYDGTAFKMDNDHDEVVLRDPDGVVVDEVAFNEATWPLEEGRSMALIHASLDNNLPAHWGASALAYGDGRNKGTPRSPNIDVFDTSLAPPTDCNDNNPCTVDICNYDKANICAHLKLHDCCTAATVLGDCNDANACTVDTCDADTNECVHTPITNCCTTDLNCRTWYPTNVVTQAEKDAFDLCADRACVGVTCRFGRKLSRPGCCIAPDNSDFGCEDRNVCTENACVADGGVDATGALYNKCVYDLDPSGDTINDCCRLPADCADGDPSTFDTCDMLPDATGPGVNYCWYKPDPNYCGVGGDPSCDDGNACTEDLCCTGAGAPHATCQQDGRCVHIAIPDCCSSTQQCIDGLACTQDACCSAVGAPFASCTGANTCGHQEAASGCCEDHADCNVQGVSPWFPAGAPNPVRTGYCIGTACRYGPMISGRCIVANDCDPRGAQLCTVFSCDATACSGATIDNCCQRGDDCPAAAEPCRANVCFENQCTLIDVPNCCEDANPAGPDPDCDDSNPCTGDYCMLQTSGAYQCRYFPTGGAGCCINAAMCPDDQVQCTSVACEANSCALDPVADCLSTSPYRMSFSVGHPVFAGEYEGVEDLAWSLLDLGTNAASDAFGFDNAGDLGPDSYLSFAPTAAVTAYDACVVLPRFRTYGMAHAAVGFDYAAAVNGGTANIRLLVKELGEWAAATEMWSVDVSADVGATDVIAAVPVGFLDSEDTIFALCISGATTAGIDEIMFDRVVVTQGRAPDLADPANQTASSGQTKTVSAAFTVTEPDIDEAITLKIVNSPGPWLKIVNLHKTATDTWSADLQINGAVCPAAAPFNYSIVVEASDGALIDAEDFVLVIEGCN